MNKKAALFLGRREDLVVRFIQKSEGEEKPKETGVNEICIFLTVAEKHIAHQRLSAESTRR